MARAAARRRRRRAVRGAGDPPARGAAARGDRARDRARPRGGPAPRGGRRARGAGRRGAAARAAARAADAGALSLRPAGRRARRLPPGAQRAGRRDRRGARAGAAAPARGDPAPGPRARAARRRGGRAAAGAGRRHAAGRGARPSWTGCASTGGSAHGGAGRLVLVAGARGIGKTRLAAELAAEVHRDRGDRALRLGRRRAGRGARRARARRAARRPTLLVLDDVDQAPEAVRAALDELAGGLAALPVLVLATAEDAGALADLHADAMVTLGPLDAAGVAAVAAAVRARGRRGAGRAALLEASGGVPQRVHRAAASGRATEAARRLGATADRAAGERPGCARPRTTSRATWSSCRRVRERAEPRDRDAGVVACPFKGLASFDVDDADFFFGRERLVAEMVARLAGAPLMGDRRALGQRQVLGAARRPARRAARGRAARAARAGRSRCCAPASTRCARSSRRRPAGSPAGPAGRRRRPVRGGLHRLPRRGTSAARSSTRSSPRARDPRRRALVLRRRPRRLLRPLRELPRAVAPARREPGPRRADAPRRAAPRDRAARAARRPARRARARRRPDRRRRGRARRAAAAVDRRCWSCGSSATGGACA